MADYSLSCVEKGYCGCLRDPNTGRCRVLFDFCNCDCPDPKPNSHQVAKNCSTPAPRCGAPPACDCTCTLGGACSGTCDYDCDDGYQWNPVTEECELIVKVQAGLHPSKVVPLIIDG